MADAGIEASLNEGALKRVDPYIKEILDTAKYVALYSFENESWVKSKIEGSFFVYSRTAEPWHNILVLNRLHKKNLIEPITPQLDLQRNDPYLMYRNTAGKIFAIWFFDALECTRLSDLVQSLMEKSVVRPPQVQANGQYDIFQMLTKAQEAFTSKPPVTNGTPQSVADFFAKAGNGGGDAKVKKVSESERTGLAQQLKLHTVEHIEKQHRVVTPQSADHANISSDPFKQLLRPKSMEVDHRVFQEPAPSFAHVSSLPNHHFKVPGEINGMLSNGHAMNKALLSTPPGFPVIPHEEDRNPDLMPPAMFTPKDPPNFAIGIEPTSAAKEPMHGARQPGLPEPLTRNQLLQALDYLLRHDDDFMTKLHEAYVKSLTEKIL